MSRWAPDILAVEDTPHNLDLMTYLLEASGHQVTPGDHRAVTGLSRCPQCATRT